MEEILIMNKEAVEEPYALTNEEREYLTKTAHSLSDMYEYHFTDNGLNAIWDEWAKENAWMIDLFKKSPNYVEGKFYIKIPSTLERPVSKEGIREYINWIHDRFSDTYGKQNKVKVGMFTYEEYEAMTNNVYNIKNAMYNHFPNENAVVYKGKTFAEWNAEYIRMQKRLGEAERGEWWRGHYVTKGAYNKGEAVWSLFSKIISLEEYQYITKDDAEYLNSLCEKAGLKARVTEGNKTAKFYGKVCVELGLDKIKDIQTITFTDNNGVVHERTKDMGYQKYRAILGDSVNPFFYDRDVYISVNPIDFWTMSLGYKWASCMTIDKHNYRNAENNYHGQFSGGTTSYMLDNASFIVYVLPTKEEIKKAKEEGREDELVSKYKRAVFILGEDKLVQSRVYPDGRDSDDGNEIGDQLRNIVQKVVADLLGVNNLWRLRRGSSNTSDMIRTGRGALQYEDYRSCSDVSVSFLVRADGSINEKRITVGAEPICPCCGKRHQNQEAIECYNCYEEREIMGTCAYCGGDIETGSYNYISAEDGTLFCCANCAEEAGYRYCEDTDDWREDWWEDDYTGDYFYYVDDKIETYEGRYYINDYNCEEDGNRYCEDIDEYSSEYVSAVNGNYYHNVDDLIEINGEYYVDEDEARENGYELNENEEWVAVA